MKSTFILLFSLLWILDTAFTVMGVQRFGLDSEWNPIMRSLLSVGPAYFILIKLFVLAGFLFLYKNIHTTIWVLLTLVLLPVIGVWYLMLFT